MKRLAPILILFVGILVTVALFLLRPEPKQVAPQRPVDQIEAVTVQPETIQLTVNSQGTLLPKVRKNSLMQ